VLAELAQQGLQVRPPTLPLLKQRPNDLGTNLLMPPPLVAGSHMLCCILGSSWCCSSTQLDAKVSQRCQASSNVACCCRCLLQAVLCQLPSAICPIIIIISPVKLRSGKRWHS